MTSQTRRGVQRVSRLSNLHPLPHRFHLLETRVVHRASRRLEAPLELLEAYTELLVGRAQRRLRLDAELPRQVGDREQQIPISSSIRAAPSPESACFSSPTSSSILATTSLAFVQSNPTAATRVPSSCAPSSAGKALGMPLRTERGWPACFCSRDLICSHCSSTRPAVVTPFVEPNTWGCR